MRSASRGLIALVVLACADPPAPVPAPVAPAAAPMAPTAPTLPAPPPDGPRVRCTMGEPLGEVSEVAQRGDGALVIATPGEVLRAGVAPGCVLDVRARRAIDGVVHLAADLARADRAWRRPSGRS